MSETFIVANHKQDLQPQKTKKTVEFPSDLEHIRFVSNPLKTPSISLLLSKKFDKTTATGF